MECDALDSPAASLWAAADQNRAAVFGAHACGCLGDHSTSGGVVHQLCSEPAPECAAEPASECAAVVLDAVVYQS